jgi:hypothetical protein
VERLGLGSGEVVPSILPPEAVEAGIEFFGKQVTLVIDALDAVIRL